MKKIFFITTLLLLTCLIFAQSEDRGLKRMHPTDNLTNQTRKAVIIGMSDYGGDKSLDNTLNDANDMADALTKLGFEVTLLINNDLRRLRTNLTDWYNSIKGNDMAVFYFSGHGMEVGGRNYLIPIGAELGSQADVQDYTLSVDNVLRNMDEKQVKMKLLILDACRDNPFTRSWSRGSSEKGLATMNAPEGTFIAFAAAPGQTAADGGTYNLRNGVFTYWLKQEILQKGLTIDAIFNRVTGDVAKQTQKQQTPFKNSSLGDDFYFIPSGDNPTPYNPPTPTPNPPTPVVISEQGVVINGVRWATRNVDAPGTFAANPEDAGMFYQWNRKKAWPATGTITGWDSSKPPGTANDPSPAGWRVPTLDEIKKLLDTDKVSNVWTTQNGVNGRRFIDKASGNSIFLPAAGGRIYSDGTLDGVGSVGDYWSSSKVGLLGSLACFLNFQSDGAYWHYLTIRTYGFSIRSVAER